MNIVESWSKIEYLEMKVKDLEKDLEKEQKQNAESNESHHKNIVELTKMLTEKDRKIEQLKQQLSEKEKELERLKKNWRISRTQQQKLYENLKQEKILAGVVNYPIILDGCRIKNEEQLLDFTKDFVLEKGYWKQKLAEKDKERELDNLFWKQECDSLQKALAEQEKQCQECKHLNKKIELNIKNKLMTELAEKEKEIEIHKSAIKKLIKNCGTVKCENKISFAVEKLEEVKELVEKRNNGTRQSNHSIEYKDGYSGCCCDITDFIDNQIKQLKEGK